MSWLATAQTPLYQRARAQALLRHAPKITMEFADRLAASAAAVVAQVATASAGQLECEDWVLLINLNLPGLNQR